MRNILCIETKLLQMTKLRCAIIGCGRIGCGFDDAPDKNLIRTHSKAYYHNPKTELIALCDVDEKKLRKYRKMYSVKYIYKNSVEMFRKQNLDCISICTFAETHFDLVKIAIDNGIKGIIIEKPISNSLSSSKKIIELCKKNNVLLTVNHQRRFFPFYQNLAILIQGKNFGKIQHVNVYYGGGIANTGSHIFDVLRLFFGEVKSIIAKKSKNKSPNIHDPNLNIIVEFKNGILCYIMALDNKNYGIAEMEIFGTKNRLNIDLITNEIKFFKISKKFQDYKRLIKTQEPLKCSVPSIDIRLSIQNLIESILKRKKLLCTGEDGYFSLELIIASLISNHKNKKILLPIKNKKFKISAK